jgi:hypothetical protein
MKKNNILSYISLFGLGLIEQFGYTLYLIAVNKYMILMSSILMFSYMAIYLGIINKIAKDSKDSLRLLLIYALACGVGNYLAMSMRILK